MPKRNPAVARRSSGNAASRSSKSKRQRRTRTSRWGLVRLRSIAWSAVSRIATAALIEMAKPIAVYVAHVIKAKFSIRNSTALVAVNS